jgi:hypothetical protein
MKEGSFKNALKYHLNEKNSQSFATSITISCL